MIETKRLHIYEPGEPSVGISSSHWTIEGDLYFETQEEFNEFKNKLQEAWEFAHNSPIGITTEEEEMEEALEWGTYIRGIRWERWEETQE